jgi:hypothetical protein
MMDNIIHWGWTAAFHILALAAHLLGTIGDGGPAQPKPAKKSATLRHRRFFICSTMKNEPDHLREARLTDALAKLPDAPMPSNFTARVLTAVESEEALSSRSPNWTWNWRLLWPRIAVAAAVLIFAGVSVQRYEVNAQRTMLAKNLALAARAPSPGVDALENLDAIQRMSQSGHADNELLAVLQ